MPSPVPSSYPTSVVGYNLFRFVCPDSVDDSDTTYVVARMPRDFARFFFGAFSLLLDVNCWRDSPSSLSDEQMVDIANNEVVFMEICEAIADCIETDGDVQQAIADAISTSEAIQSAIQNQIPTSGDTDTVINNTVYSNTVLIAGDADANNCGADARYGRIVALVDYINQVQLDFYESIDAALNVVGEVANLISAIPLFETLPIDEAINTIGDTGEQWEDSYTASETTQLREAFYCDLFCRYDQCDITVEDVRQAILSRYNVDTTQGAINQVTLGLLLTRIAGTVASAGGLTYVGDDFVYLSWLLQLSAVEGSGEFFGVSIEDYVREASDGSPSGAHSACDCDCDSDVFDFTVSDFSAVWDIRANPPPFVGNTVYVPGVGYQCDTPAVPFGIQIYAAKYAGLEIKSVVATISGSTTQENVYSYVPATNTPTLWEPLDFVGARTIPDDMLIVVTNNAGATPTLTKLEITYCP